MKRAFLFVLLAALLGDPAAAGSELPLGPVELDNLGIDFEVPDGAEAATAVDARAQVVVPPSADFVISSAVAGLVERVHAGVGDSVTIGQALLSIRSPGFLTLQQEYLEAVHDAMLADAQLRRDRQLVDEGIVAARRLEESRAYAASAAGRLAEHRQLLRIAGMREADIGRLTEGQGLLETLVVRSPVDGVVLDVPTRAGQSVDTAVMLCRVADLSTLWLDIRVPQQQLFSVVPGAPVAVRESPVARPAVVRAIGQAVDPATQTASVRAELTVADHGLRPGQLVAVAILADERDDARSDVRSATFAVPTSALVRSGDAAYVFVRSPKGVTPMPVTVVAAGDGRIIVRGLERDAEIAVAGVSALKALWLVSEEAG